MTVDLFSAEAYRYELPPELIAQYPCKEREGSRLLLVDRKKGDFSEIPFRELIALLDSGDGLVFNDTKVIPARLSGKRSNGAEAEIFLLKKLEPDVWEAMARPGKKLPVDSEVVFGPDFKCRVIETYSNGNKAVRFYFEGIFDELLSRYGQIPLPRYIHRPESLPADIERYQTVFAANPGAVAAPTAGLHFSREMLERLHHKGVACDRLTLHVGPGTFKPVQTEDIRLHPMHSESFIIEEDVARSLNARKPEKKQICVGTTSCRALESAADAFGNIIPGKYETDIFIYPGYTFKYVRSLLTNFHLPCSTLLMLVSAFAGYELTMEAYRKAIKDRFRFYSYGDAMLIL